MQPELSEDQIKRLNTATKFYTQKRWAEAQAVLESVIKKAPRYYSAGLLLAKNYFFSGNEQLAIDYLGKLVKKYPHYYEAHFWLARFYYLTNSYGEARKIIEYLLSINSQDQKVYYLSSLIDIKNEKLDTALDKLYLASISREDVARVYYKMGEIFLEIGSLEKAEKQLARGKNIVEEDDVLYEKIDLLLQAIEAYREEER